MTEEELKEVAKQLAHPQGEFGTKVAELLNQNNRHMIRETIRAMHLQNGEKVLETGHASTGHLEYLMAQASKLTYSGVEVSALMQEAASCGNATWVESGQASFALFDGIHLSFPDNSFDKIFSVNTVFFWEKPAETFAELARVRNPGGRFCLCYGTAASLRQLPVTRHGFRLYEQAELDILIGQSPLFQLELLSFSEDFVDETRGETIQHEYRVLVLSK